MIEKTLNKAVSQLEQVREVELENLVKTLQQTISVEKLLEGTGLQELATELQENLIQMLSGTFLAPIKVAIADVEETLKVRTLEFDGLTDKLEEVRKTVWLQ